MGLILVVDDRSTDRELLVTLLRYAGHQTLEAKMGDEALVLIRAERPDLVLCDMLMPRMDGYQFARTLRGDPQIADTRVIFYSATYDEAELYRLAEACGALRVLEKPQEPAVILAAVAEALETPASASSPPAAEYDEEHRSLVARKRISRG